LIHAGQCDGEVQSRAECHAPSWNHQLLMRNSDNNEPGAKHNPLRAGVSDVLQQCKRYRTKF
ncbi:hypothetical protein, partial [Vreelandella olivaria]|uniref:hypothetical protein n=1 Tax=Vreelandella olivaria TaxID=390919 RepID=UPI00201F7B99